MEFVQNYALRRVLKLRSDVFLDYILPEIICSVSHFHIAHCIETGNNKSESIP
jgi:hypothetical protein